VTVIPSQASDETLIGLNRLVTAARLMSGAVHDVNNALQVISGTVEILEARSDIPPPVQEALARLRGQSARAAGALAQTLVFTRATRGGQGPINLRELAEESLALRDFSIRRAGLSARLVTEGPGPFVVVGNRGDMQQVLLNLLMNAERALAGRTGSIIVQLALDAGAVVLRVIDEGAGVTLSPADRAFEPFVSTYEPFESAGLGLWAARALVEQCGGTLTVETPTSGAVFAARLPAFALRPSPAPTVTGTPERS